MKSARRKENVPNNTKPGFVESGGGEPPLRFTVRLRVSYKGWCNYHAVPLNSTRLNQFRVAIQKIWLKILRRRSQRAHRMTWAKFGKLCRRWLPNAKIIHPYPEERFARHYPR